MRTVAVLIVTLLVAALPALGNSAGTTGFELLRTEGSARNSALGGSQIAVGGDLQCLSANPAGLADFQHPQAAAGFFKHVMDLNSGCLAYVQPVKKVGVLGLGVTYFDYGTFDRASEWGEKQGEFGASDILVTGAAARTIHKALNAGVSVKFLYSTIDSYTATALAADIGVLYHTGFNGWDVGAGVFNAGFATSAFIAHKDNLPVSYRLGLSVPLQHLPVRVSLASDYMEEEGIRGSVGLELTLSQYLQGRVGYNTIGIDQRIGLDKDALAGFSAGLGIHIRSVIVDYALTSQGEIGYLHRFSVGTSLPRGL